MQRALKPGEAAIEFVHYRLQHPKTTDSVMYAALILRPGDINPRWVTLFEEKQLKALINKQPNQLYGSTALYDIIWKPLGKMAERCTTAILFSFWSAAFSGIGSSRTF